MGDNGRQDHFRAQETDHTNQHQGGQISSCIKNPNSKLLGEQNKTKHKTKQNQAQNKTKPTNQAN